MWMLIGLLGRFWMVSEMGMGKRVVCDEEFQLTNDVQRKRLVRRVDWFVEKLVTRSSSMK